MTPAITAVKRANVPHRIHSYQHDANAESYGNEAAEKLRAIALSCWITPVEMREFGMPVSLHVGQTELEAAAAVVAQREGAMGPHLADKMKNDQFASEVAYFIADAAAFKASNP